MTLRRMQRLKITIGQFMIHSLQEGCDYIKNL